MDSIDRVSTGRSDLKIHVKLKLSALWTTTTICYVYGDLFGFFKQQTIAEIGAGTAGPISTQAGLLGAAVSVAIPSVMIVLTLLLAPNVSRWTNIVVGSIYTLISLLTMPGGWFYYLFLGGIESILTLLIVAYAWSWPKATVRRFRP